MRDLLRENEVLKTDIALRTHEIKKMSAKVGNISEKNSSIKKQLEMFQLKKFQKQ